MKRKVEEKNKKNKLGSMNKIRFSERDQSRDSIQERTRKSSDSERRENQK